MISWRSSTAMARFGWKRTSGQRRLGISGQVRLGDVKIQLRLADGFVAGVEKGLGLRTVLRAQTLLLAVFGIFDVEHAAGLAAVKDKTLFHGSDFFSSEAMKLHAALGVSATPNRLRIPSFPVVAELLRCNNRV